MGAQTSVQSIFSSPESNKTGDKEKPRFNFSGIKDLTRNSYFSCLCASNEANATVIEDLPSPEFPGNRKKSFRERNSGKSKSVEDSMGSFKASPIMESPSLFDNELEVLSTHLKLSGKCMAEIRFEDEINMENSVVSIKNTSLFIESPIFKPNEQDSLFFNDC